SFSRAILTETPSFSVPLGSTARLTCTLRNGIDIGNNNIYWYQQMEGSKEALPTSAATAPVLNSAEARGIGVDHPERCPHHIEGKLHTSIQKGVFLFLGHGQQSVQADLTMPILESPEKVAMYIADEQLENCRASCSVQFDGPKFPRASSWSSGGSEKLGHSRFHQPLMLWGLQYYCKSQYYFLPSTEGKGCTNMTDSGRVNSWPRLCTTVFLFDKQERCTGGLHKLAVDKLTVLSEHYLLPYMGTPCTECTWTGELPKQTSSREGNLRTS
ncbi:hypothetical protein U0070_014373, partial [Myodes glareolus]